MVRRSGEHCYKGLLWLRSQTDPTHTDSSSTNQQTYANSGNHGNEKKQEVVMISLCVLSSSPACGRESLDFLFSAKIRDVLQHVCAPVLSYTKKVDDDSLEDSGRCPGPDNASEITYITQQLYQPLLSGTFSTACWHLIPKNMAFQVKSRVNLLTWVPLALLPCSNIKPLARLPSCFDMTQLLLDDVYRWGEKYTDLKSNWKEIL